MLRRLTLAAALAAALPAAARADDAPPAGFTPIFNGKDLTHWKGAVPFDQRKKLDADAFAAAQKAADEKAFAHWKVEDGVLTYDGKGVSLATAKDYGNFELLIDWKIEPKGDSGIYLRGQPQVQVWDSSALTGNLAADKGTGSGGLWNNPRGSPGKVPLKNADKAPGEWNTFRIRMVGDKVTVHLNGELVVDNAPLANYWEKGQPLPAKGPIELQHHGDKLWFRNISVKELPDG